MEIGGENTNADNETTFFISLCDSCRLCRWRSPLELEGDTLRENRGLKLEKLNENSAKSKRIQLSALIYLKRFLNVFNRDTEIYIREHCS